MRLYWIIAFSLFLYSCAQIGNPVGGPKDDAPPKIILENPVNNTLNFSSKNIIISFDEYINLKNLNNELIISPSIEPTPEIKVKNKSLIIDLHKSILVDSTTYVFNLGNSIVDVNEGNPINNFQYQFSTGDYIDSLFCAGKITNALTNLPEKEVTIMLYTSLSDTAAYKAKPYYVTKSNTTGEFKITNIKSGIYQLIALKEGNKNYKFDDKTELIGFLDKPISITKNIDSLELRIFQETDTLQYIKKINHPTVGKIEIILSLPSDSSSIKASEKFWVFNEINASKDSLVFWYTSEFKDSTSIIIQDYQHHFKDTLFVSQLSKKEQKTDISTFLSYSSNLSGNKLEMNQKATFSFPEPIEKIDTSGILLFSKDSTLLKTSFRFTDNSKKQLEIDYPYKSGNSYRIILKQNSIKTILGKKIQTNDTINFAPKAKEDYGTFKLSVKMEENKKYILQLTNSKNVLVTQRVINKSQDLKFELLTPDTYKVEVFEDNNGNGKWDTGNFLLKKQAERKYMKTSTISIRSNWDLEEDWIVK